MEKTLDSIFAQFERTRDNLIPILQRVQDEFTYLPEKALAEIADYTHVPASEVYGVATFYAQFRFSPTGENLISVCRGTAYHVRGAPGIIDELSDQLSLNGGDTTEDNQYTVETVACVGCCALAPVLTLNEEVHGDMSKQKVRKLIQSNGKSNGKSNGR